MHSAAASGGSGFALGKAVRYGVSRGIFSHEAGMGSAPLSYASAPVSDPARQGLMGVAEVFVDTFLVCMLTAFALLIIGIDGYGQDGMTLMMAAFSRRSVLPVRRSSRSLSCCSPFPVCWAGIITRLSA